MSGLVLIGLACISCPCRVFCRDTLAASDEACEIYSRYVASASNADLDAERAAIEDAKRLNREYLASFAATMQPGTPPPDCPREYLTADDCREVA